jgi:hypothetical protein
MINDMVALPKSIDDKKVTRFATCSLDQTIRFWNFVDPSIETAEQTEIIKSLTRNAYNKDMSKLIYVNPSEKKAPPQEP